MHHLGYVLIIYNTNNRTTITNSLELCQKNQDNLSQQSTTLVLNNQTNPELLDSIILQKKASTIQIILKVHNLSTFLHYSMHLPKDTKQQVHTLKQLQNSNEYTHYVRLF